MCFVPSTLEGRLGMEISAKKSVSVASRVNLSVAQTRYFKFKNVSPKHKAKLLSAGVYVDAVEVGAQDKSAQVA